MKKIYWILILASLLSFWIGHTMFLVENKTPEEIAQIAIEKARIAEMKELLTQAESGDVIRKKSESVCIIYWHVRQRIKCVDGSIPQIECLLKDMTGVVKKDDSSWSRVVKKYFDEKNEQFNSSK